MGYQESFELYLNLSRKELQQLCKKKNLPANRSHTQLAKSLALLSKKKIADPTPSKVKLTSVAPNCKESGNVLEDKSKDERRTHFLGSGSNKVTPCLKEKEGADKQQSMAGDLMTTSSHMDHQASDNTYTAAANAFSLDNLARKQSDCSTSKTGNSTQGAAVSSNIVQIEKDTQLGPERHVGETLNEVKKYSELRNKQNIVLNNVASKSDTHNQVLNIMPRVAKSSTKGGFLSSKEVSEEDIPSFQFFVLAEEGINLHIDLNSSPSEWINSLKDEVSINLKMQDSESTILPSHTQCFSEEADAQFKISAFENVGRYLHSCKVNRNSDCTTSTLSSDSENCQSVAPQPDATFVSSDSLLTSSSIPVKMPGYLNGNQVISSCATPLSEQKHMPFDTSSYPGDGNAFSEELRIATSGREKSNTSVIDISMGPLGDLGMLSSDGARHPEQMECCSPKINGHSNVVETCGLGNSLASIPEENNLLKSDGTRKVMLISDLDNIEIHNASSVFIERQPVPETSDVAADHDKSSNFCEYGGHLLLNCSATEADSDSTSVDHIHNSDACGLASIATDPDPIPDHELGNNTPAEEKETSECSLLQKSSENNSKRSHNFEFQEEFCNKRHHSSVKKKNGMMVNLRSTRTSAKGTICEQVIRPRRSTRLRST